MPRTSTRRRPGSADGGSARDRTLATLLQRIVTLQLPPGTALSENELAADLGVSRTPVRESLIVLRGQGLVEVFPQVGTFVSLVDPDRVAEAQFIREAIECSSLQMVDPTLAADDHRTLRDNLDRQQAVAADNLVDEFFQLDEDFHRTLLRLAGHESAWATVTSAKTHLDRARRLSLVDTRPLSTLVDQHRAVADALVEGHTDSAVGHLRTHLRAVFDDVERIRSARPELFKGTGSVRPTRRTVTELAG